MVGPLDPAETAADDRAESEAEAANRQNQKAGQANEGFGEPGGETTHTTGGTGPTGQPAAATQPGGMASEGDSKALPEAGAAEGMLGEGV